MMRNGVTWSGRLIGGGRRSALGRAVTIGAVAAVMACSSGPSIAAAPSTAAPSTGATPTGATPTVPTPTGPPLTGPTLTAAAVAPEVAGVCNKHGQHLADIDGDSAADTLVGMPSYRPTKSAAAGAVDVHGTKSGKHLLRAADLTVARGHNGGFGSAIAMADLDGDWCVDAVIGTPNEQSDAAPGNSAGPGQVYIVFGGPHGLDPGTAVRLPRPATTGADGFGSALALFDRRKGANDTRDHLLYVGAPGTTIDGKAQAGEVWRYRITATGSHRVKTTRLEARHPGADGVPGLATAGDRFGEILASIDRGGGGVLVGVPSTDVGAARDAGAVWSMPVDASGALLPATMWTQDSPDVPDTAEAGDRFGASLGSRSYWVAVGVPGEDLDSVTDGGLVQVFALDQEGTGVLTPGRAITQDSPGVPGIPETGDRFGAAVGVGASLAGAGSGTVDAAIGVPGEDIGAATDAGMIDLVPVSDLNLESILYLRQGGRLTGKAETGDALGSVLAVGRGPLGFDEDYTDLLLIGVPSEDIGDRVDAGMFQRSPLGLRSRSPNLTFSKGYRQARHYGQILPSSAD